MKALLTRWMVAGFLASGFPVLAQTPTAPAPVIPFVPAGKTTAIKERNTEEYLQKLGAMLSSVSGPMSAEPVDSKALYNRCRQICVLDPRLELVYGLTYLRAGDAPSAVRRLSTAAGAKEAILPAAFELLLHQHAEAKDYLQMSAAAEAYALRLSSSPELWPPEAERERAAGWLGRFIGTFLKGPVLVRKDKEFERILAANERIEQTFPPTFLAAYQSGRTATVTEYEKQMSTALAAGGAGPRAGDQLKELVQMHSTVEASRKDAAAQMLDQMSVTGKQLTELNRLYREHEAAIQQLRKSLSGTAVTRTPGRSQNSGANNATVLNADAENRRAEIQKRAEVQLQIKAEADRVSGELKTLQAAYKEHAARAARMELQMRTMNQGLVRESKTEEADLRNVSTYVPFSIEDAAAELQKTYEPR